MFDDIGKKLQSRAKVLCWIGIIASIIGAFVLWSQDSYRNPTGDLGLGVLIGGCAGSWLTSAFLYGFGQLVEDVHALRPHPTASVTIPAASSTSPGASSAKPKQTKGSHYEDGMRFLKGNNYMAAASAFAACGSYLDATMQEKECYYRQGVKSMADKVYSLAAHNFSPIPGYKDADVKKAECEKLAN